MLLCRGEPLIATHQLVTTLQFNGHSSCGSREMTFNLPRDFTRPPDKGSYDFMEGNTSWNITIPPSLVAIVIVVGEIYNVFNLKCDLVKTRDQRVFWLTGRKLIVCENPVGCDGHGQWLNGDYFYFTRDLTWPLVQRIVWLYDFMDRSFSL